MTNKVNSNRSYGRLLISIEKYPLGLGSLLDENQH